MKNTDSLEEHLAKFKILLVESKIDDKSLVVIDLFRETLPIPLQRRILTLETTPTTLKDWYNWATKLDYQWRKMQRVIGRTTTGAPTTSKDKKTPRQYTFARRETDPNAMDVD